MPKPGYTKSWRKDLDSDVWKMGPLYFRVWHYLLQTASWEKNIFPTRNRYGIHLNPGQGLYSIQQIVDGTAWVERNTPKMANKKTILNILKWLEWQEQITRFSNGSGTFITICNWRKYQSKKGDEVTESTPESTPVAGPEDGHTKEVKEVKEEEEDTTKPPAPPKEPKKTGPKKPADDLTKCTLKDVSFEKINPRITSETVKAFILHRKVMKSSLTQNALELTCSSAMKCAEAYNMDPNEAIMYGIQREWKTVNVKWLERDFGKQDQNQKGAGYKNSGQKMTPRQQYMDDLTNAIEATDGKRNNEAGSDGADSNDGAIVPVGPLS